MYRHNLASSGLELPPEGAQGEITCSRVGVYNSGKTLGFEEIVSSINHHIDQLSLSV
jgi:hypothetical protein